MKDKMMPLKATFSYIFLFVIGAISIFPTIWMADTSIKGPTEIYTTPPTFIVQAPTFSNYLRILFESNVPRAFLNSTIISISAMVLTLLLSILGGYGFSRYKFTGSGVLSYSLMFGQMMPAVVLVIPLYIAYGKIGLLNTYPGLILPNLAIAIPMATMMLRSFFANVPRELEEAAKIDGSSTLGALFRIILPISTPGLVSVGVFSFLTAWEEFLFALNLTTSSAARTLPIAINMYKEEFVVDWGAIMTIGMVVSIPVLSIFLLCNKYFVKGLTEGSVKG